MDVSVSGHPGCRSRTAVFRLLLAGLGLMTAGCGELPMAVTVGHSPVAYTQPQAGALVAPGITTRAPLAPMVAPMTPPPVAGAVPGTGAPGGGAAPGARSDDPVVTVPGYTFPAYSPVGARSGG